jgi:hypothetical protein
MMEVNDVCNDVINKVTIVRDANESLLVRAQVVLKNETRKEPWR